MSFTFAPRVALAWLLMRYMSASHADCCGPSIVARWEYIWGSVMPWLRFSPKSSSFFGSRSFCMMVVICSMSRQLSPDWPGGQYLPAPYMASISAPMRAISAVAAGSLGPGVVSASLIRSSLRRMSYGRLEMTSKRAACLASSTPRAICFSFAAAAISCVS